MLGTYGCKLGTKLRPWDHSGATTTLSGTSCHSQEHGATAGATKATPVFPQTSFAVAVLTRLLTLYGARTHSKSCCGPVAPAVAPGVAPWLYGKDPHSKSCCGPSCGLSGPRCGPHGFTEVIHTQKVVVAPWPQLWLHAPGCGMRCRLNLLWPRCDPMASA